MADNSGVSTGNAPGIGQGQGLVYSNPLADQNPQQELIQALTRLTTSVDNIKSDITDLKREVESNKQQSDKRFEVLSGKEPRTGPSGKVQDHNSDSGSKNSLETRRKGLQRRGRQKSRRTRRPDYSSESFSDIESVASDSDVSMGSQTPVARDVPTPQQVIHMQDYPLYQVGEDLHIWWMGFDSCYVKQLDDIQKMYKAYNKLIKHRGLYKEARKLAETYNSYPRYRSKLLKLFGKSDVELMQEFNSMVIKPNQRCSEFYDELYTALTHPALKLPQKLVVLHIYQKLPSRFQKLIPQFGKDRPKTTGDLRSKILAIENNPIYLEIRNLQRFQQSMSKGGEPDQRGRQNRYDQKKQQQPERDGRKNEKDHKPRSAQVGTVIQETSEPEEELVKLEFPVEGDGFGECYFVDNDFEVLAGKTTLGKFQKGPRTAGVQKTRQGLSDTHQNDTLTTEEPDNFDSQAQNIEGHIPQQEFRYYADQQLPLAEMEKQVKEQRLHFNRGKRIYLKEDLFIDENGNYDLSSAEQNIFQSFSLKQLAVMRDRMQQGLPTIYHQQFKAAYEDVSQYCSLENLQKQVERDIQQISGAGQHLVADVKLQGVQLEAVKDSAAQRTIISEALASSSGLLSQAQWYSNRPSVRGLGEKIFIARFIKNAVLELKNKTIMLEELPIVEGSPFGFLIGSDVFLKALQKCSLHFHDMVLNYQAYNVDGLPYIESMPLRLKQDKLCQKNIFSLELYDKPEKYFSYLDKLQGIYDLLLVDLPLEYPVYFNSSIPYPTYSMEVFFCLRVLLDRIMSKNSVVLIWASGKSLPVIFQIMQAWGYQYINCLLVWVKLSKQGQIKLGLGYWSRQNSEFLVFGRRGSCAHLRSKNRNTPQTFFALADQPENTLHSSKPVLVYELISKIFDLHSTRNLEMFAREKNTKVQTQFFDLYGEEIPDYFRPRSVSSGQTEIQNVVVDCQGQRPENRYEFDIPDLESFYQFVDQLNMSDFLKRDKEVLEVLAKNRETFDYNGKVGQATNIEMEIRLKEYPQTLKTANIRYDPERESFLKKTIEEWFQKGYVCKGFTKYAFPPVVVPKKTPPYFRVCYNFQQLNELMLDIDFKGRDPDEIRSQALKKRFKCKVDCAAAHQQIKVAEASQPLLGLKTSGGTVRSKVGQFGILTVAKWFNQGIYMSIGHLEDKGVYVYADDIVILADDLRSCLDLLDQVLTHLRQDGYVVSSKKCELFQSELNILGEIVGYEQVKIDPQRVEAIRNIPIPQQKKGLQSFIGCLTYVRKYIPNLAQLLVPLYEALKGPEPLQLSQEQIQTVRHLQDLLTNYQVLRLPDFKRPFYLTIAFGHFGYGATLMQTDGERLLPIAYRSKLGNPQVQKPQYLLKAEALAQALKEWRYLLYGRKIVVLTDSALLRSVLEFTGDNVQLNKYLMKIHSFNIEVQVKPESFRAMRYSQFLVQDEVPVTYMQLETLLQNYETLVNRPKEGKATISDEVYFENYDFTIFFDGACTKKKGYPAIGSFGYVIYNQEAEIVHQASGRVSGQDMITNNVCENFAMLQAIEYLADNESVGHTSLQVVGDSELVVKQLKGQYRINSNNLRFLQRQVKLLLKRFKHTMLKNVPRRFNTEANDLAQSALKLEIKKELEVLSFAAFAVHQPDFLESIPCTACGSTERQDELFLCDLCGLGQHRDCLGELLHPGDGAFYCRNCDQYIFLGDPSKQDVTQDSIFLQYLRDQTLSLSAKERERCQRLSKFYALKNGTLYFLESTGPKRVPSVGERHILMLQVHQSLGHPGEENTFRSLRSHYFWPNILGDTKGLVKSCRVCQAKKGSYLPMPTIFPTYKGLSIWQYVAVDLLEIRDTPDVSQRYVLSCIDAYSKAPELVSLPDKRAKTVAQAFQDQVIFRYGCPLVVRSDEGTEFRGEFQDLMRVSNILHLTTGPAYPQGNGQVERLNRVIKNKLQSLFNTKEYSDTWTLLIQTIAWSIRISRSRATKYSPYQIMYGREPLLPGHFQGLSQDVFYEECDQGYTAALQKLSERLRIQRDLVGSSLEEMNNEIRETIESREFKAITNLQFGQAIFVRNARPTKLNFEVEGPNYFVRYMDINRRDQVLYYQPSTRRFLTANISNLKLCDA